MLNFFHCSTPNSIFPAHSLQDRTRIILRAKQSLHSRRSPVSLALPPPISVAQHTSILWMPTRCVLTLQRPSLYSTPGELLILKSGLSPQNLPRFYSASSLSQLTLFTYHNLYLGGGQRLLLKELSSYHTAGTFSRCPLFCNSWSPRTLYLHWWVQWALSKYIFNEWPNACLIKRGSMTGL